jgi:DNA-binding NarL/FixJ family response regulator
MSERPVTVVVVEDQLLVRRGLVELLEPEADVEVVGEAKDGVDALPVIARLAPDVALVDARMPRMDGVELVRRLAADHPGVAAVILTTFDDDEYVFGGLRAGAKGYLLKDTSPEELVAAIKRASRGETVLGGPIAARLVAELTRAPAPAAAPAAEDGPEPLTKRELEVIRLVGRGATNAEIADALFISEGTAKNNVSKILRKLDLRDRTQLALYAARRWPDRGA